MAKMFYTLDEAAAKLKVSASEVQEMVKRGQLSEFRDRDKLMFKADQVDLLSGAKEEEAIPLAPELEPLSLSSSGTAAPPQMSLATDTKEQTGISIFEADQTEDSDPSAVTRVSPSVAGMTAEGSGMGMTAQGEDTGLAGVQLDEQFGTPAAGLPAQGPAGDQLFEGGGSAEPAPAMIPMMAEAYDGPGSGLSGGFALAACVACLVGICAVIFAMTQHAGGGLATMLGDSFMIIAGVMGGLLVILPLVGWALGRR